MNITIRALNKEYRGGVHALNDLVSIPNGMFGLLGPNGAHLPIKEAV